MSRLCKFAKLPRREQQFFLQSLYLLFIYRIYLNFISLHNLLKIVARKADSLLVTHPSKIEPKKMTRLISVASSLIPCSTCLSQALAGQILFAMNGHKTTLHIGVSKKPETGFEAHAWLCQNGEVVLGWLPDIRRYQELPVVTLKDE